MEEFTVWRKFVSEEETVALLALHRHGKEDGAGAPDCLDVVVIL